MHTGTQVRPGVCTGTGCFYPGGHAIGYHFHDVELVTLADRVDEHQFELVRETFQSERFEQEAGAKARSFVEALFAHPLTSSFLRIGPNDLRLGCTYQERWGVLGAYMRSTFCRVYGFDTLQLTQG